LNAHFWLQALIDQVYENGSYGYDVDYSQPLSPADDAWAQEWLREDKRS